MSECIHFIVIMLGLAFIVEKFPKSMIFLYEHFIGKKIRESQEKQIAELEKGIEEKQRAIGDQIRNIRMLSTVIPYLMSQLSACVSGVKIGDTEDMQKRLKVFAKYYSETVERYPYLSEQLGEAFSPVFEKMKENLNG